MNMTSGVYLRLLPGCHCVRQFSVVQSVTDILLVGAGDGVQMTCSPGLGLVFLNVTGLTLQGITILGCGMNGSNSVVINSAISALVDLFIQLPEGANVAVVIASCTNVVADHVTIVNTTGLGLAGVNVAGVSNFTNCIFSFNMPQQCFIFDPYSDQSRDHMIGGGATFLYMDYINRNNNDPVTLNIENNTFSFSSYCGLETYMEINQYFETFRNFSYTMGASGGLSLGLAQQKYSVSIDIQGSHFENNTATFGSAVSIYWYAGLQDTHINFTDCTFTKNGLLDYEQTLQGSTAYLTGGGVLILKDLIVPQQYQVNRPSANYSNTVVFLRSQFLYNSGYLGSGVLISSLYSVLPNSFDTILFDSCHFEGNSAMTGPALYIAENKASGLQSGLVVRIQNCTFVNNSVDQSPFSSGAYAVVQVMQMNITINGSSFLSNTGTAVGGIHSLIILEGEVDFENNTALAGGSLNLISETLLLIRQDSVITFNSNFAIISGGAIYVDYYYSQRNVGYAYDCFLHFETINAFCTLTYQCTDLTVANISLKFSNNKSRLGGMLYGSTLDSCPWAANLKKQLNQNGSTLQLMYENGVIFHLDQSPNTSAVLSTPVRTLDLAVVVNMSSPSFMPGQEIFFSIFTADQLNQSVTAAVIAQGVSATAGDSEYWLTSTNYGTNIYGQQNTTRNITLYSLGTYVQSKSTSVALGECSFGFEYNSTSGNCQCSAATLSSGVTCDEDLKAFNVRYGQWFGPGPVNVGVVLHSCLLDYCQPQIFGHDIMVEPQAIDNQCTNNRGGLLCGGCQKGYSAVLGTNRCLKCDNNSLALIIYFAAAGIGIITIISFLHITFSEGYIGGALFYASMVSSYEIYFTGHFKDRSVIIPIYMLNLDMGFETCFYDGMTQLDRAGLSLIFPIYLFILMILFIWLASYSLRLSEWLAKSNYSPSKLVATLIILSYNSITQSSLQILGYVRLTVHQDIGKSIEVYAWATDPNVAYFSPLHTVLFVVSVIILAAFTIPIPVFLLLPTFTSRFVWRMKPLYDAFFSYYREKFTFWISMRLIIRILLFNISLLVHPPLNILLLGLLHSVLMLLTIVAQPYKRLVTMALESFFLSSILLLITGSLRLQALKMYFVDPEKTDMVFVFVVVGAAYVVMLGILVWHVILRFPKLCKGKFSKHTVSTQPNGSSYGALTGVRQSVTDDDDESDGDDAMMQLPKKRNFVQYREPLLDVSMRLSDLRVDNQS